MQKKNRTLLSVPDQDGRFTWSPGAEKLPTAPGGSWRRDDPGWVKSREWIHSDLRPACVFVCPVSPTYIYNTCVLQWVICAIKKLTAVSLVCLRQKWWWKFFFYRCCCQMIWYSIINSWCWHIRLCTTFCGIFGKMKKKNLYLILFHKHNLYTL